MLRFKFSSAPRGLPWYLQLSNSTCDPQSFILDKFKRNWDHLNIQICNCTTLFLGTMNLLVIYACKWIYHEGKAEPTDIREIHFEFPLVMECFLPNQSLAKVKYKLSIYCRYLLQLSSWKNNGCQSRKCLTTREVFVQLDKMKRRNLTKIQEYFIFHWKMQNFMRLSLSFIFQTYRRNSRALEIFA